MSTLAASAHPHPTGPARRRAPHPMSVLLLLLALASTSCVVAQEPAATTTFLLASAEPAAASGGDKSELITISSQSSSTQPAAEDDDGFYWSDPGALCTCAYNGLDSDVCTWAGRSFCDAPGRSNESSMDAFCDGMQDVGRMRTDGALASRAAGYLTGVCFPQEATSTNTSVCSCFQVRAVGAPEVAHRCFGALTAVQASSYPALTAHKRQQTKPTDQQTNNRITHQNPALSPACLPVALATSRVAL